ncbi:hypothetical protein FQA39_LY11877 [Lamprigera yunnana]|nr:hypothetical protein FQA39_LY11877 [Lamprigera yunnana]
MNIITSVTIEKVIDNLECIEGGDDQVLIEDSNLEVEEEKTGCHTYTSKTGKL